MTNKYLSTKLADLIHLHYGDALKSEVRKEGKIPVFGSNGLVGYHDKFLIDFPTVIIGRKGSVGAANYSDVPSWIIDTAYYTEIKNEQVLDLKYFFNFAKSIDITKISQKGVKPGVNRNDYLALDIPLPPLPEQRRIVAKLDSLFERINKAISLVEENIKNAQSLMASVLNEVFAECHTKYPTVKISDIAKTKSGGTPNRSVRQYWNGDIVWLKSGELNDCLYIVENTEFITIEGLNNSSATIFPTGTLLIAMYGATAGKLGILGINASTNQAVCSIQNDKGLFDPVFLFFYLYSIRGQILTDSTGGAQPNISKTYIDAIEIPLPPVVEQIIYVKTFLAMDAQKKQLISRQSERVLLFSSLKSSLLDAAFKGAL